MQICRLRSSACPAQHYRPCLFKLRRDQGSMGRVFHKPLNPSIQLFLALAAEALPEDVPVRKPVHVSPIFECVGNEEAAVILGLGPFLGEQRLAEPLEFPGSYNVQQAVKFLEISLIENIGAERGVGRRPLRHCDMAGAAAMVSWDGGIPEPGCSS